jgi:hypothetical protein
MSRSIQDAAAQIVALINSSPRSPRQEEIEAILTRIGPTAPTDAPPVGELRLRLHNAEAGYDEALAVAAKTMGPEFKAAEAQQVAWGEEIAALEKEIPSPPRRYEDLVARAEVARHGGDVIDGKLMEAENDEDVFLGPAARLVEAVLQLGGAGPAAMSPTHAAHYQEWRALIEEHARRFPSGEEDGKTPAEIKAEEARMSEHMEAISRLACRIIHEEPVRTWGDVALRAQIFFWIYWPGIDPEAAEAPAQIAAGPMSVVEGHDIAMLLEAIFSVAGVGQFATSKEETADA